MKPTIKEAKAELRAAKMASRSADKTSDKALKRICASNVQVWKLVLYSLENHDFAQTENERLRYALTKIARRKPCTYTAASAFYLCRRDAQEALKNAK